MNDHEKILFPTHLNLQQKLITTQNNFILPNNIQPVNKEFNNIY